MLYARKDKIYGHLFTTTNCTDDSVLIPVPENEFWEKARFLDIQNGALVRKTPSACFNGYSVILSHNIPDSTPANGIPEIPGDGVSFGEVTCKIMAGDTYDIKSTGSGVFDFTVEKTSSGGIILDKRFEGKVLKVASSKGMLNKTSIVLDATSKGTFKLKSEARTCVGADAAVITLTPVDSQNCSGATLTIEFGPVEF